MKETKIKSINYLFLWLVCISKALTILQCVVILDDISSMIYLHLHAARIFYYVGWVSSSSKFYLPFLYDDIQDSLLVWSSTLFKSALEFRGYSTIRAWDLCVLKPWKLLTICLSKWGKIKQMKRGTRFQYAWIKWLYQKESVKVISSYISFFIRVFIINDKLTVWHQVLEIIRHSKHLFCILILWYTNFFYFYFLQLVEATNILQ